MKKINILVDYPVIEGKYTGQTFPNIIYNVPEYLSQSFEVSFVEKKLKTSNSSEVDKTTE